MRKEIKEEILENEAVLGDESIEDHSGCHCCEELYLFHMKDNYHEFAIGLTTVLNMLSVAEAAGAVPELPADWWNEAKGRLV